MKNEYFKNRISIFYWLAALFVIIDQSSKLAIKGFNFLGFAHRGIHYSEQINVIGSFLHFIHVENPGGPFSIQFGSAKIFLSLFSVIASIALSWYLYKLKPHSGWIKTGVALILAGAVGNLIDRVFYGVIFGEGALFYGRVVDFIQVDIPSVIIFGTKYESYPIFNVADSVVTIGVALLIIFNKKIPSYNTIMNGKKPEIEIPVNLKDDSSPKEDKSATSYSV